jgi:hypothetical protein
LQLIELILGLKREFSSIGKNPDSSVPAGTIPARTPLNRHYPRILGKPKPAEENIFCPLTFLEEELPFRHRRAK